MQTNTVIIVQKTSKGDVSGNTACTSPGSTCITSTGGKITVRSPLGHQSPEPRLGLLNAYLALSAVRTMLPSNYRLPWDCRKVLYACPCSFLLPCTYISQSSCYRPVLTTLSVPYSFLSSCIQYRAQSSTRVHQALVPALPTY